jgi:hypothetical protein
MAQQQHQQEAALSSALAGHVQDHHSALVDSNIIAAMKSIVGQFDENTVKARSYEDFFRDM